MLRAPPSPDPKVTVAFLDRQLERENPYVQFKLRSYGPACLLLAMDFYSGTHGLPKRIDL